VAVGACTVGIESSEKFAEGTASPCHGELIVFSLLLLAFSSRFSESLVSGLRCLLLSLVSGCPFLASVNKLRKGKDAAAERLCSTGGIPPTRSPRTAIWQVLADPKTAAMRLAFWTTTDELYLKIDYLWGELHIL